jgi:hypothetical protein
MHDAWETAKGIMKKAQEKKERDVNRHRRDVDFDVKDKVYIKTTNWKTDRPSKKLSEQMAGPFDIVAKEGHSYRLGLPQSMKVYPVFPTGILRKDPNNPLPGQANAPAAPIHVTAQEEYEVQEIIAVKETRGLLKYRAKWTGADDDPEFYTASSFMYSPHLIRNFHFANPKLPGPPRALDRWIKAWEEGIDDYEYLEDDSVATTRSRTSFFRRGGNVTAVT